MPNDTKSETSRAVPRKLRRLGLIYRITASIFALSAILYAVNIYRHDEAEFDIAMSVLQFALAIVFFAVGAMYYWRANAGQNVPSAGIEDR